MKNFDHVVRIDEASRELTILRRSQDGTETLFTSVSLPSSSGWDAEFEDFAKQLGENILLDSPVARKMLGL
jgi:hypothetical protein